MSSLYGGKGQSDGSMFSLSDFQSVYEMPTLTNDDLYIILIDEFLVFGKK